MLKFNYRIFLCFSLFAAFVSLEGCRSEYQKILKSTDVSKKLAKAKEYYQKKDYFRSIQLFDELVNIYRGTDDAEEIYYYYALCNYGLKDYITARYHFKTFSETYPKSKYAEECRYMAAYCYYLESPKFSLDQDNTYKAIEALQLFVNLYPKSERVASCNDLIDDLRAKLEQKAYENAKLYLKIGDYKASVTSLKNAINDFPDSPFNEEISFMILKSSFLYAENSIETKQYERYKEALSYYQSFKDAYPKSKYLKEATRFFDTASKRMELQKSLTINSN